MGDRRRGIVVRTGVLLAALTSALVIGHAGSALAHEGEENVPAITDVQEAIAILAEHQGTFPAEEVADHANDKIGDALESEDARGVLLALVKQAQDAMDAGKPDEALTLLERSIGACPGAPVIEPQDAPRRPPALASPCPEVPHILALEGTPVGGSTEAVLLAVGVVLILGGLALTRRIR